MDDAVLLRSSIQLSLFSYIISSRFTLTVRFVSSQNVDLPNASTAPLQTRRLGFTMPVVRSVITAGDREHEFCHDDPDAKSDPAPIVSIVSVVCGLNRHNLHSHPLMWLALFHCLESIYGPACTILVFQIFIE